MHERAEIDRHGNSFAIPDLPTTACSVRPVHCDVLIVKRIVAKRVITERAVAIIRTLSLIPNYTLYNVPDIRLNIQNVGS